MSQNHRSRLLYQLYLTVTAELNLNALHPGVAQDIFLPEAGKQIYLHSIQEGLVCKLTVVLEHEAEDIINNFLSSW